MAGAGIAATGLAASDVGGLAAAGAGVATTVFGTTLRAIGRGLGNGTWDAATTSAATMDRPRTSTHATPKPARRPGRRGKALRSIGDSEAGGVTAILLGESTGRNISSSI
jgi:hypothetical protein